MRPLQRSALLLLLGLAPSSHAQGQGDACAPPLRQSWSVRVVATQSSPPDPAFPFRSERELRVTDSQLPDLDGDGVPERVVPEPQPGDCVQALHFGLYLSRTCFHRAGALLGTPDPSASGPGALLTRTTTQEQPDPRRPAEQVQVERRYALAGGALREVSQREQRSVCHHCPHLECRFSPAVP